MNSTIKSVSTIIALLVLNGFSHTTLATSSTQIQVPRVTPAVQAYLLAASKVTSDWSSGSYDFNFIATNKRCSSATTPTLSTSVSSIWVRGELKAIQGLTNTLMLDPRTYRLSGRVSSPVNIAGAWDSGATVNWEIWCQPKTA